MTDIIEPDRVKKILGETISQIFPQMVFLEACVISDNNFPAKMGAEVWERVAIDVLKPVSLQVEFKFTSCLKNKVLSSLFNEDEMILGDDSLLEILNITTGNFLVSYFGPQIEIKMELPEYLYSGEQRDSILVASTYCDVEGSYLCASLFSMRYHY